MQEEEETVLSGAMEEDSISGFCTSTFSGSGSKGSSSEFVHPNSFKRQVKLSPCSAMLEQSLRILRSLSVRGVEEADFGGVGKQKVLLSRRTRLEGRSREC